MTIQRITLPSFGRDTVTASEMRQLVSALELRLQGIEDIITNDLSSSSTAIDLSLYSIFDLSDVGGTPADDDIIVWSGASFITQAQSIGGGGGINAVVEDLSPQLGGNLDANTFNIVMGLNTITDARVANWIDAYSWGNHALVGYVTRSGTPADNQIAIWTGASSIEGDSGLTWNGNTLGLSGNAIDDPVLTDYGITHQSVASSSGSLTVDYSAGQSVALTLTEDITTVTISNPPPAGTYGEMVWTVTQDSTARSITWPASVVVIDGTDPDLSTTDGLYKLHFDTIVGGTTWFLTAAGPFS